jgi:hypothetical protein
MAMDGERPMRQFKKTIEDVLPAFDEIMTNVRTDTVETGYGRKAIRANKTSAKDSRF